MLNSKDFTERLKIILEHEQLSASTFADKIGVQRSSISHILSGRNKPSLDFILKVTSEFNQVDLHWLLYGSGVFPKKKESISTPNLFNVASTNNLRGIQRIVVFYNDGTFDEYKK